MQKLSSFGVNKFIFVASSDVLEHFDSLCIEKSIAADTDLLLFAHESSPEVGRNHGVYVMDEDGTLKAVLQKPSLDALSKYDAFLSNGLVLTDSCYAILPDLAHDLIKLRHKYGCFCSTIYLKSISFSL